MSARSNHSMRSSFYSNMEILQLPQPNKLKLFQEILTLITQGPTNTRAVIDLIKKLQIREIVQIRGLYLSIEDMEHEDDPIDTIMWNPLHFAVYYGNFELVKFFISDLKVNIALTASKANAESEKDAVNTEKYPEDKIMLLLIAFDRQNRDIFWYLLHECYYFWPHFTINQLLKDHINT